MAEWKSSFGEIGCKSLFHSRVVPFLIFPSWCWGLDPVFFFFFSLRSLSRFFNDFEVKTLVNAGKSMEMCCCKCYYWVNMWSLCYHLLTAGVAMFFSHISFSKYFFSIAWKCFRHIVWMFSDLCPWSNSILSISYISHSLEASSWNFLEFFQFNCFSS